jgi:hypothetical protein
VPRPGRAAERGGGNSTQKDIAHGRRLTGQTIAFSWRTFGSHESSQATGCARYKSAERGRKQGVVRVGGWWNPPRYALGYVRAARAVSEISSAASGEERRQLSLPYVFLLRYAVELAPKQLIARVADIEEDRRHNQQTMGEPVTAVTIPRNDLKRIAKTHDLKELLGILDRNLAIIKRGSVPVNWTVVERLARLEGDAVDLFRYGEVRWRRSKRGKRERPEQSRRRFPREKRIPVRQRVESADRMVHEAVDLNEDGSMASILLYWNYEAEGYAETLHQDELL